MTTLSPIQFQSMALSAEDSYRARFAQELRRDLGDYVDDLTEPQLLRFVGVMLGEARSLGFRSAPEMQAFARPCVVYGALSHLDPLFEPMFYAPLPGPGARRRLSAAGVSEATREVLAAEFRRRTGAQLVADLAQHFLVGEHPAAGPRPVLEFHFHERAQRLRPGALEAHLALAGSEADALGLTDPDARRVHGDVAQLLGACFARDPLYPWAELAFSVEADDARRVDRLRAAMRRIASRVTQAG